EVTDDHESAALDVRVGHDVGGVLAERRRVGGRCAYPDCRYGHSGRKREHAHRCVSVGPRRAGWSVIASIISPFVRRSAWTTHLDLLSSSERNPCSFTASGSPNADSPSTS